jgi:hypothetical protein
MNRRLKLVAEIGVYLGIASVLGTLALLILNLRVNGSMSEARRYIEANKTEFAVQIGQLRTSLEHEISGARSQFQLDIKAVEVEIATLRGDLYKEHAGLYANIMDKSGDVFMGRETSLQMHAENSKRLDALTAEVRELAQTVKDVS